MTFVKLSPASIGVARLAGEVYLILLVYIHYDQVKYYLLSLEKYHFFFNGSRNIMVMLTLTLYCNVDLVLFSFVSCFL